LATALDARFKSRPFTNKPLLMTLVTEWVQSMMAAAEGVVLQSAPIAEPVHANAADDDDLLVSYTDAHPCIASSIFEQVNFCILGFHVHVYAQEIAGYMSAATIPIDSNPYEWWSNNEHLYPYLAKAAAVALSAPPSSVPRELVFSLGVGCVFATKAQPLVFAEHTKVNIFAQMLTHY